MRPRIKFLLSTTLFSLVTSIAGVGEAGASSTHGEQPVRVAACDAPRRADPTTSRGPAVTTRAANDDAQGGDTGTVNDVAADDGTASYGDGSAASSDQETVAESSADDTASDGGTTGPSRRSGGPARSDAATGSGRGADQADETTRSTSSGRSSPRVGATQRPRAGSAGSADRRNSTTTPDPTGGETGERSEPSSGTERTTRGGDRAAQRPGGKRGAAPQSVPKRTAPTAQVTSHGKRGPDLHAQRGPGPHNNGRASNGQGKGHVANAHAKHAAAGQHGHGGRAWGPNARAHGGHVGKAMARRVAILRFKRCLATNHGSRQRAACGRYLHGHRRPHER